MHTSPILFTAMLLAAASVSAAPPRAPASSTAGGARICNPQEKKPKGKVEKQGETGDPRTRPGWTRRGRRVPDLPARRRRVQAPPQPAARGSAARARKSASKAQSAADAKRSSLELVGILTGMKALSGKRARGILALLEARAGDETRAALLMGLKTRRTAAVVALARLLELRGTEECYRALERRALLGLSSRGALEFARILSRWKPAQARATWLSWLVAKSPGLRAQAERRLLAVAADLPLAKIRALLDHDHWDVRRRAMRLLRAAADPLLGAEVLQHLDESYPPNVEANLQLLVSLAGEDEIAEVLRRVREFRFDRPWAIAVCAVLRLEEARSSALLGDGDLVDFLTAIAHPNLFIRSAAAAAVAAIGMRSESEEVTPWLRQRIPHALVACVGGLEGDPDLPLLRASAIHILARLSGEDLSEDGAAWRAWWLEHSTSFVPRRAHFPLRSEDAGALEVTVECDLPGHWPAVTFKALPAAEGPAPAPSTTLRYLDRAGEEQLITWIEESGVQRGSWAAGSRGPEDGPSRGIVLRRGQRTKRIVARGGIHLEAFERLFEHLQDLVARTAWEPYLDRDAGATWREYLTAELPWWRVARSDGERCQRLKARILAALDDIDPALRRPAFLELQGCLGEGKTISREDAGALLAALEPVVDLGVVERAFLQLLSGSGDPQQIEMIKVFFARRPPRDGDRIALAEILAEAGRQEVLGALQDGRAPVQAAAAEAAASLGSDPPIAQLIALLESPYLQVRLGAIHSLGDLRVGGAVGFLITRLRDAGYAERLEAAEALARIGDREGLHAVGEVLREDDPMMRRAIFTGLADSDSLEAAFVLGVFAIAHGRFEPDSRRARFALLCKPQDQIRSVCQRLIQEEDPALRREAVLLLAESLDRTAGEAILDLAQERPGDYELRESFEWISCRRFSVAGWVDEARVWLRQGTSADPLSCFVQAARAAGYPLRDGPEKLRLDPSRASLKLLCEILKSPSRPLRMHAARLLFRASGDAPIYLTPQAKPSVCEALAKHYLDILAGNARPARSR